MVKLAFLILMCTVLVYNKIVEQKCPAICECDMYENLRRASCTRQNLIMIESEVPKMSEILDLSYNYISDIDNRIFRDMQLQYLKILNVSHNNINNVHMNAFEGLDLLETLDLSFNTIQYLLNNWFWSMPKLQYLYLRGNHLQTFKPEGALIESSSLKLLDISWCRIVFLHKKAFTKTPNLETLDLSGNFLTQLDVSIIQPLKKLNVLAASNNTWDCCNAALTELTAYCKKYKIKYTNDCPAKPKIKENQFERMISLPKDDNQSTSNSWIFDDGTANTTKPNITSETEQHSKPLLMQIIELSPILAVIIPFVVGLTMGLIIGCNVQIKSKQPKKPKRFQRIDYVRQRVQLLDDCQAIGESTPLPQRRG